MSPQPAIQAQPIKVSGERLIQILRRKRPKLGLEADHKNSRRAAIELFCIECVGGARTLAVECSDFLCPLWPFRPGAEGERPAGAVPTIVEYEALSKEKLGDRADELKARGQRLAQTRGKAGADTDTDAEETSEVDDDEDDDIDPFEV